MSSNSTGDAGWFPEKMMVPEYDDALRKHKKGDIFTIDLPEQKWYSLALKTNDDTYITTLLLIRLKN